MSAIAQAFARWRAEKRAAFVPFLRLAEREAGDDRNYVKRAVSWALRQIGKRSPGLRRSALASAGALGGEPSFDVATVRLSRGPRSQ